jgi:hypothetical protein
MESKNLKAEQLPHIMNDQKVPLAQVHDRVLIGSPVRTNLGTGLSWFMTDSALSERQRIAANSFASS